MKILFTCLVVGWALLEVTSGRLIVRHKRQIEKEGEVPAAEVVVIKDTNGTFPPGPRYDFTPNSNDNDSVIDLDVNENDGTFNFGGHLPHIHDFHHFHRSFSEIFDAIQKRFEGKFPIFILSSSFVTLNIHSFLCIFLFVNRNDKTYDGHRFFQLRSFLLFFFRFRTETLD